MIDRDEGSSYHIIYASRVIQQDLFHRYDTGNRADIIVYTHTLNRIIAVIKHIRADAIASSPTSQPSIEKRE